MGTLGQVLDAVGVTTGELQPDDLVEHALVIMKVLEPDGKTKVAFGSDPQLDWVTERGLLSVAWNIVVATAVRDALD